MPLFRRLQTPFCAAAMAACLLPGLKAQQKTSLSPSHPENAIHSSAKQDLETLFALAAAYVRKPLQEYAHSQKQSKNADALVYCVFEIGSHVRRYRIVDWQPVPGLKDVEKEGGLAGDWAEVAEKVQTRKGDWSDQGGWSLYHRISSRWQRVASHEGIGYDPGDIHRAHVPRHIIQRLKLEINE